MDIRLKSAKPSALLKDPLPKGSKVPKGPASSAKEAELQGIRDTPSRVEGKYHLLVLNSPRSRGSGEDMFLCHGHTLDRVMPTVPLGQEGRCKGGEGPQNSDPPLTPLMWGGQPWGGISVEFSPSWGDLPWITLCPPISNSVTNEQAARQGSRTRWCLFPKASSKTNTPCL